MKAKYQGKDVTIQADNGLRFVLDTNAYAGEAYSAQVYAAHDAVTPEVLADCKDSSHWFLYDEQNRLLAVVAGPRRDALNRVTFILKPARVESDGILYHSAPGVSNCKLCDAPYPE